MAVVREKRLWKCWTVGWITKRKARMEIIRGGDRLSDPALKENGIRAKRNSVNGRKLVGLQQRMGISLSMMKWKNGL